jgi:SAM-dependent methyltransferase
MNIKVLLKKLLIKINPVYKKANYLQSELENIKKIALEQSSEIKSEIKSELENIKKIQIFNLNLNSIINNNKEYNPELKIIKTFEELDEAIDKVKNGDSKLLTTHSIDLNSFYNLFGSTQDNIDPYSTEYMYWEMSFFEFISQKKYNYSDEGINKEELSPLRHPTVVVLEELSPLKHPTVALEVKITKLLIFQIELIEILGEIKNKNVLEMGCGFGNTAVLLESCGCNYYAVDSSKNFSEITKNRVYTENTKNQIQNKNFYEIDTFDVLFDLVIFEASFHHVGEPEKLLKLLYDTTKPLAKVVFIHEPFHEWYDRPWGLVRNDLETFFQIRTRGWLEFGYRTDFFKDLLNRTGWEIVDKLNSFDGSLIYVAEKKTATIFSGG